MRLSETGPLLTAELRHWSAGVLLNVRTSPRDITCGPLPGRPQHCVSMMRLCMLLQSLTQLPFCAAPQDTQAHCSSRLSLSVQGYTLLTDWVAKVMMPALLQVLIEPYGEFFVLDTFCVIYSKRVHAHTPLACYVSCVRGSTLLPSWTLADLHSNTLLLCASRAVDSF